MSYDSRDAMDGTKDDPSPYCSLYITRRQMEAVRAALSGKKVKRRDAEAALRWVEEALG